MVLTRTHKMAALAVRPSLAHEFSPLDSGPEMEIHLHNVTQPRQSVAV